MATESKGVLLAKSVSKHAGRAKEKVSLFNFILIYQYNHWLSYEWKWLSSTKQTVQFRSVCEYDYK